MTILGIDWENNHSYKNQTRPYECESHKLRGICARDLPYLANDGEALLDGLGRRVSGRKRRQLPAEANIHLVYHRGTRSYQNGPRLRVMFCLSPGQQTSSGRRDTVNARWASGIR